MTITLPLPSRKLWPNARIHWRSRHTLTKAHRARAKIATHYEIGNDPLPYSSYTLAFYFADRRKRDDDNAAASCKAYRDGIADALGIDDHNLRMSKAPAMLYDKSNPRLEITLLP